MQFERPGLGGILFPIGGGNRECFNSYLSIHESNDGNTRFFNQIQNYNNGELVNSLLAVDDLEFNLEIMSDSISGTRIRSSSDVMEPSTFQAFESISIENRNFENILLITNPDLEPEQIYLASNLGLVAFNRNDTLWLRN